jgi:ribosomal protein S18 acetylase RimI-like enzyme
MAGLIPRSTGIVAIIVEQKYAIGFLSLVQHTKSLFSIKFVFVNPKYRKMGIAARLIDYAICQAKQRGAKKIYLNADINNNSLVNYYRKLGFDLIIDNSMLWGNGFSAKLPIAPNNHLTYLNIRSKTNIDRLLKTYTRYMGKQWVDFLILTREIL